MHTRFNLSFFFILFTLVYSLNVYSKNSVYALRIWPAEEYTRLTIESAGPLDNDQMILKDPERVVIDLKDTLLNDVLKMLPSQLSANDPNINSIRVAQYTPSVTRIVIDLKTPARVKIFSLKPIEPYKDRLVIDLYRENHDSILSLLKQIEEKENFTEIIKTIREDEPMITDNVTIQDIKDVKRNDSVIIAIDAGHGGEDPGAIGRQGTHEKMITLEISKKLKALIDNEKNMQAVLIRDGDYFVPLGERVKKARKINADIFISIHADAVNKRSVKGSSIYALSEKGATSAFAKLLANRENASDLIGGVSIDDKDPLLAKTLLDLSQSATVDDSIKLGNHVLREIKNVNNLHKKYVEQAGFAVLKAPYTPSILVETAFISNPDEEKKLKTSDFQEKLVRSILDGIKSYIKTNPSIALKAE